MLWRLLWGLSRGVRPPGGGAVGLPRPRPVGPVQPHEGEPWLGQEPAQTSSSWHGRNQQHKACGYGNLSHCYTPLDAFTWSTLAFLAMELAKHVRWLSSVQVCDRDAVIHQLEGQLAILSQQQQQTDSPTSTCSSKEEEQHFFVGVDSGYALKNPFSIKTSQPKEYAFLSEREDIVFLSSTRLEPDSSLLHLQGNLEDEESVKEAASQVQQVFQASISMASNILGLENIQDGQQRIAFSCFKLAADQNYSKSQFNVGLCYEHGRGTKKNMAKAALYYQRAAHQGHPRAQCCYAKWLLHHCPRTENGNIKEAVAGPGTHCRADPAVHHWYQLPLAERTFSSSPCLQSLDQPLTPHVSLELHHSWSTGSLRDVANSSVMPSPSFSDGFSFKLQFLA
ncbi:death ligand signal enhancer [Elgaria multicarinata webbii]|uniref:death ligand signal enhancer n=1 Tax=Elgaria multicarinata webbii TaxID=159646 RepID=UPI002FCD5616